MSDSYVRAIFHITFWKTKNSPRFDCHLETELYKIINSVIQELGGNPIIINGTGDHIHILSSVPKTIPLCSFIEKIKTRTSNWIKRRDKNFNNFYWQHGYGGFSVSAWEFENVIKYIEDQKKHHKKMTYREELIKLLKKHGMDFDERYLCE